MFTEADKKKLEELKAKEKQAKQDARNEQKRVDRMCKKLFGMSAKDVQERVSTADYWYNRWNELNELSERLLATMPNRPKDFKTYVEWREQKAQNVQADGRHT